MVLPGGKWIVKELQETGLEAMFCIVSSLFLLRLGTVF